MTVPENVEGNQLDEISHDAKVVYKHVANKHLKKMTADHDKTAAHVKKAEAGAVFGEPHKDKSVVAFHKPHVERLAKKIADRKKGLERVDRKLANEEVEVIDEISHDAKVIYKHEATKQHDSHKKAGEHAKIVADVTRGARHGHAKLTNDIANYDVKRHAKVVQKRAAGLARVNNKLANEELEMDNEQLDELSKEKLSAYKDAATSRPLAKDGDKTAGGILKAARKRVAGVKVASKKLGEETTETTVDAIDEGIIDGIKGLVGQSKAQKASRAFAQRKQARDAANKPKVDPWAHVEVKKGTRVNEDAEALEELNRDTLNSYDKKANADLDKRLVGVAKSIKSGKPSTEAERDNAHKAHSRTIGTMRSQERLHKEEVDLEEEVLDELSKETHKSYRKAARKQGWELIGKDSKKVNKRIAGMNRSFEKTHEAVDMKVHDELEGDVKEPASVKAIEKLTTKGQLKMMSKAAKAKYVTHTGAEAPGTKIKEEVEVTQQIDELSTSTLGAYKKAAGADASAADKAGNFKRGNKRFSGIVKATKKQFANDVKKESFEMPSFTDYVAIVEELADATEEQLAEISQGTLKTYVLRAKTSRKALGAEHKAASQPAEKRKITDKMVNRQAGIASAQARIKEEVEELDEGLRLLGTHGNHGPGGKSAKVYKDTEWDEHRVKFYTNGEHHKDADYHTTDKEDAHDSAKAHVTSPNR